jgi:NAD(P)H-hydrate epimerase
MMENAGRSLACVARLLLGGTAAGKRVLVLAGRGGNGGGGLVAARHLASDGAPELVVDALLGYGQTGPPQGGTARLIGWSEGRRVLALDVPSGLELRSGTCTNRTSTPR